jgi:alpha-tubulin suppressor-like RCC1 family protein
MRSRLAAGVMVVLALCLCTSGVASAETTRGYLWGAELCGAATANRLPKAIGDRDFVSVDGGDDHALWLTGSGQVLIQGGSSEYDTPGGGIGGYCYGSPKLVAGLSGVVQVAAGRGFSLALLPNGTVMAWGGNDHGQLGDGTTVTRGEPRPVPGLTGVRDIAAGNNHALALLSDGSIAAWGFNNAGQLGDGTTTQRLTPVLVLGLTGVRDVAAGAAHSLAITADRQVRAWGENAKGQLGDTTTVNRTRPVTVMDRFGFNLPLVNHIDAAESGSAAISDYSTSDGGRVYTWGLVAGDAPGSPVARGLDAPLPPVGQIAVGRGHVVVNTMGGEVYAWGANGLGQIGNNQQTNSVPDPTRTIGHFCCAPAIAVAAAGNTSLAIGDTT